MNYSTIPEFQGQFRFLSNFWVSGFEWNGSPWSTAEAAYQCVKCADPAEYNFMRHMSSPGAIKRYGRRVLLRDDWEEVKVKFMADIVLAKFTQSPHLTSRLLDTGYGVLIEGNSWGDTFWGQVDGVGDNHLGRILMDVRHKFRISL
jgi:ribA/ribD-fused uncharacterized protein